MAKEDEAGSQPAPSRSSAAYQRDEHRLRAVEERLRRIPRLGADDVGEQRSATDGHRRERRRQEQHRGDDDRGVDVDLGPRGELNGKEPGQGDAASHGSGDQHVTRRHCRTSDPGDRRTADGQPYQGSDERLRCRSQLIHAYSPAAPVTSRVEACVSYSPGRRLDGDFRRGASPL